MKQIFMGFTLLLSFTGRTAPAIAQDSFLGSETFMTLPTAKQRWKEKPFNAGQFRSGNTKARASMAVSLIAGKTLLGKTPEQVRATIGEFSGFFWSDSIPAYLIEEGWAEKKDTWQLVFLLDDRGRVNDVKIHKNCCAASRDKK